MKKLVLVALLGNLSLLTSISDAQSLEYVGSTFWSRAFDVKVDGNLAYTAFTNGLAVIDISNPAVSVLESKAYCPGWSWRVALSGQYAYVANLIAGIYIFDISNHLEPVLLGACDTTQEVRDIIIRGNYAYVSDYTSFKIYELTDPANPALVGAYPMPNHSYHNISLWTIYAYVSRLEAGFDILDISDPANPAYLSTCHIPGGRVSDIDVSDGFAYITDGGAYPNLYSLVRVIDVSIPSFPEEIAQLTARGGPGDLFISDSLLYCVICWDGIHPAQTGIEIINISDPHTPQSLAVLSLPQNPQRVYVVGNYTYSIGLGDEGCGPYIGDISDPANPTLLGQYDAPSGCYKAAVSGDYAFVTDGISGTIGLRVLDLTAPDSLPVLGICDTPGLSSTIEVNGRYVYVADGTSGVEVIDISDLSNPRIVGNFYESGACNDIKMIGNYLYITSGASLIILDISDPSNPQQVGQASVNGYAILLDVVGQRTYVTTRFPMGLEVFDISNPQSPVRLGRLELGDQSDALDFCLRDNWAYLGTGGFGIKVVDISDPANMYINFTYGSSNIESIAIAGDYLYYGNNTQFKIANISYEGYPYSVASLYTGNSIFDIKVDGEYIYLATHYPFMVFKFNQTGIGDRFERPQTISLSQNYPNPFNAQTTIKYSLSKAGPVRLSLYNIMGQKVTTLIDGIEQPGEHQIVWDASTYPSGVYFARLEAGEKSQNIKMVLLK